MANRFSPQQVVGVILAGGRSSRMSSSSITATQDRIDKSFCQLNDKTLIEHVIARAKPQVETLIINANQHLDEYQRFNLPVIPDCVSGHLGPLAGILSAMEWMEKHTTNVSWLASFATDSPLIPNNLVEKLWRHAISNKAQIACAYSNQRSHPVIALWSVQLQENLKKQLLEKQIRKVERWTEQHALIHVNFDNEAFDPFLNINTQEDLATAQGLIQLTEMQQVKCG